MFDKTGAKTIGLIDNMSFLKAMTVRNIKFSEKGAKKKQQKNLVKIFLVKFL